MICSFVICKLKIAREGGKKAVSQPFCSCVDSSEPEGRVVNRECPGRVGSLTVLSGCHLGLEVGSQRSTKLKSGGGGVQALM